MKTLQKLLFISFTILYIHTTQSADKKTKSILKNNNTDSTSAPIDSKSLNIKKSVSWAPAHKNTIVSLPCTQEDMEVRKNILTRLEAEANREYVVFLKLTNSARKNFKMDNELAVPHTESTIYQNWKNNIEESSQEIKETFISDPLTEHANLLDTIKQNLEYAKKSKWYKSKCKKYLKEYIDTYLTPHIVMSFSWCTPAHKLTSLHYKKGVANQTESEYLHVFQEQLRKAAKKFPRLQIQYRNKMYTLKKLAKIPILWRTL